MEPWEDELLWDDDSSDEEEDTDEQIEEADLEMDEDSFADWEDSSDTAPVDETLEEALAEERTLELERELEQDEHPRDYHAELEDEEEEAAPTSEKRLKREIRAEALKRLEEAARTESDFLTVVDEWNKLDRNRERRERDHENLRGDVPLEFQAVPDPKIAPLWMNLPRFRQLCQGNFLDIIFSCPYELHELTANRFLSKLFFTLSDEQKEVLYYLFVKQWLKIKAVSLLPNWKGPLLFHFSRKMIFQSQSTILCLKKNTLNCWPNSIRREPLWRKIVKRLKSKMQIWINFVVSVRI